MKNQLLKIFLMSWIFLATASPSIGSDITILTSEFPPFNYTEANQVKGISTIVVRALLDKVGIDKDISVYPWSRAYKTAIERENVLIFTIARTPDREHLFEWIGVIVESDTFLFSRIDRDDINIVSLEDAKDYSIGAVRNGIRAKYLYENGFTKIEEVKDTMSNAQKMKLGRLDLWVEDENAAYSAFQKMGIDPHQFLKKELLLDMKLTGYLAMSKGSDANIVRALKQAFIELKASGEYERLLLNYSMTYRNSYQDQEQ